MKFIARSFALFLACVMLLGVLPFPAQAASLRFCSVCNADRYHDIVPETKYYQMIDGTHCKWVGTVYKCQSCRQSRELAKRDYEVYEAHSFNSSGVCVCGAKGTPSAPKPCDHGGTTVYDRVDKFSYTYAPHSSSQHIKYTKDQVICPCGAVVNENNWESYENHSFSGGTCIHCKATQSGSPVTPPPTAAPATTPPPQDGECTHYAIEHVLSTHYIPSTAERHNVRKTILIACKCGKISRQETKTQIALHVFDENGQCTDCGHRQNGEAAIPDSTRYILSLSNAQYYTGENSEKVPYVTQGDVGYVYVTDLDSPDDLRNLTEADLHIETSANCSNTGLMVTFNAAGMAEIYLVRTSTGERLATLAVGVTALTVEDSGWTYEDFHTNEVQLKDMESINWKSKSLLVANNVFINDFEVENDTVKFEAYNGSTMIYVVVSYDDQGREIGRKYIEGYDATTGMIESMAGTFAATGRIFDTKMGNDDNTKKTDVELPIASGGEIRILQPNEDLDLWGVNFAEMLVRSLDLMNSQQNMTSSVDWDALEEMIKTLGKEEIGEIAINILVREYGSLELVKKAFLDGYLAKEFFNSQNLMNIYIRDFTVELDEHAKKLGIALLKETVNALEDVAMLALAGASGGLTVALNTLLDGMQVAVDTTELYALMRDFVACMEGEDYVAIDTIVIPDADYEPEAAPVYGAPTGTATIRTGPGTKYSVVGYASQRDLLTILGEVPGEDTLKNWYKVRFNGQIGYVSSGMVDVWN